MFPAISESAAGSIISTLASCGARGSGRQAIEETLLADGFAVSSATLTQALEVRELSTPRLVVLNDSADFASVSRSLRRLKDLAPVVGVPVLVLGRVQGVESSSAVIAGGAAAYFAEPLSPEPFLAAARCLAQWQGRGESTEKRRLARRPLYMTVDVGIRARDVRVEAQMLDASGGGCRLDLPECVASGEVLRIAIRLQDTGAVGLSAVVRWARPMPSGHYEVGVRFTGTSALLAGKVLGLVPVTGLT